MPGLGAPASDSAGIGIADWVQAVADEIDAAEGPVAVVGHSGGGNVAWGAADARPGRVARVVLVDTAVPHDGGVISEFEIEDGVIPFPAGTSSTTRTSPTSTSPPAGARHRRRGAFRRGCRPIRSRSATNVATGCP